MLNQVTVVQWVGVIIKIMYILFKRRKGGVSGIDYHFHEDRKVVVMVILLQIIQLEMIPFIVMTN